MGQLRELARRVAGRIARKVAQDDLFEKPGERPATGPLPAKPAGAVNGAGAAKAAVAKAAPAEKPAASVSKGETAATTVASAPKGADKPAPVASAPKPAEKAPTEKAPTEKAPAAEKPAEAAPAATPTTAARPKEGCIPVDVAGLRAALVPSGKPLVVNHWATWCDPCVDELPRLVRAAAGVADLGEFVGVSWDLFDHPGKPATVAKKVAKFADSAGVGYASVLFTGTPEELFAACGLDFEQIPQTIVFAPDGRVVYHKKGVIDHDDVFPLIDAVKGAR